MNSSKDSLYIENSDTIQLRKSAKQFQQNYTGQDFVYIETLEEEVLSAWQRFKHWLAEVIRKIFKINSPDGSMKIVEFIFQTSGILIILFVIYKIVIAFMNDNGNWVFGRKSDKVNIESTSIEQDIHQANFETLINEAINKNNYRLAIRYYYLSVLKSLSDGNKIDWDYEKTNYDYYKEIENIDLKKQFQYISYIYNYCWYGEFDIDVNEFKIGENAFRKLIQSL